MKIIIAIQGFFLVNNFHSLKNSLYNINILFIYRFSNIFINFLFKRNNYLDYKKFLTTYFTILLIFIYTLSLRILDFNISVYFANIVIEFIIYLIFFSINSN